MTREPSTPTSLVVPRRAKTRLKLAVESLEERATPANNLTIENVAFNDSSFVRVQSTGPTTTIRPKTPDAHLSLKTIQDALKDPGTTHVIISSDAANGQGANDGNQAGNITWDALAVGNLDFSGFGAGKTLTFQTVSDAGAVGNITLTSVQFDNGGTNDQILLEFDTSEPNGSLSFLSAGGANPTVSFQDDSVRNLTIQTGTGAFTFTDSGNASAGTFAGSVAISAGPVTLNHVSGLTAEGDLAVNAGGALVLGTAIQLTSSGDLAVSSTGPITATNGTFHSLAGAVSISGSSVSLDGFTVDASGDIVINGPLTVQGSVDIVTAGAIAFNGSINGAANLDLSADGSINVDGHIGSGVGLISLDVFQGDLNLGIHNLQAAQVTIGEALNLVPASLGLAGTLTGNLLVQASGVLAPGGLGTVGIMLVTGNVTMQDADLAIDFGAGGATDQLVVTGDVTLAGACQLGDGLGTGQLTAASATLLDYSGTLIGEFINAGAGVSVLVGTDAISVLTYAPKLIVVPYNPAGGVGSTTVGSDPTDGTGYKVSLTGGGQVLTGTDWLGRLFLVARNTTAASKLSITTIANASDDIVAFPAGVVVTGPLASFSAAKVDIGEQFRVSGSVISASFRDFLGGPDTIGVEFGGAPAQLTAVRARNILGNVRTGSTLSLLKVAQDLGEPSSSVTAPVIGTISAKNVNADIESAGRVTSVKVTGNFEGSVQADSLGKFDVGGGSASLNINGAIGAITGRGERGLGLDLEASQVGPIKVSARLKGLGVPVGFNWNVTNGIASLAVGALADLEISAKYLGAITVKGNTTIGMSGTITAATFTLTGNDGSLGKYGLKSLTAKGNVLNSRFDVQGGNVGAVTVGRFHDSQLWLGYTPGSDFTTGTIQAGFKLASFKTTAIPTADPAFSLNWAFKGSEIVADSIGTVTLSGLQSANGGTDFGIKVRKPVTTILVLKADVTNDPDLPLNKNLTPDKNAPFTPLVGNFQYIQV